GKERSADENNGKTDVSELSPDKLWSGKERIFQSFEFWGIVFSDGHKVPLPAFPGYFNSCIRSARQGHYFLFLSTGTMLHVPVVRSNTTLALSALSCWITCSIFSFREHPASVSSDHSRVTNSSTKLRSVSGSIRFSGKSTPSSLCSCCGEFLSI